MATEETSAEGGEAAAGTLAEGGESGAEAFPPFDSTTFPSQLLWLAITFVALLPSCVLRLMWSRSRSPVEM